ncbi:MAG: hypothetical protein JW829_05585 [Pirellulales bacterium]|nr:hypothetical protein [Pirellulales bacterium]
MNIAIVHYHLNRGGIAYVLDPARGIHRKNLGNAEGNAVAIWGEFFLEAMGCRLSNLDHQRITEPRSDSFRIFQHGQRYANHLINLSRFRPVRL